jgi:hypothetical protein
METEPSFPFKTALEWFAFVIMILHLGGHILTFHWLAHKQKKKSNVMLLLLICSILGLIIVISDFIERFMELKPYSTTVKNIQSWALAIAILLWTFALLEIIKLFGSTISKRTQQIAQILIVIFHISFALPMYFIYFFDPKFVKGTWMEQWWMLTLVWFAGSILLTFAGFLYALKLLKSSTIANQNALNPLFVRYTRQLEWLIASGFIIQLLLLVCFEESVKIGKSIDTASLRTSHSLRSISLTCSYTHLFCTLFFAERTKQMMSFKPEVNMTPGEVGFADKETLI